jgi:hypothetical protein
VIYWGTCPECLAGKRGRSAIEQQRRNHSHSDQSTSTKPEKP